MKQELKFNKINSLLLVIMHKATELFHKTGQEENQHFGSGGIVCWVIVLRVL